MDKPLKQFPRGMGLGVLLLFSVFSLSLFITFRGVSPRQLSDAVTSAGGHDASLKGSKGFDYAFEGFTKNLSAFLSGARESVAGLGDLGAELASLSGELDSLESDLVSLMVNHKGDELITRLTRISGHLGALESQSKKFQSVMDELGSMSPTPIISGPFLELEVARANFFLDAFLAWIKSDLPRHVLVMFQNSSEMRPAGGFFGSYADVVIKKGNIESVDVRDINDADRELELKTVPPRPLQTIVKNWRAADANWFFDFPLSASAVLNFMNASQLYAKRGIVFEGAIAVSPEVFRRVLSVTGPISIEEKTFTEENFLTEIQKLVQARQEARLDSRREDEVGMNATNQTQEIYPKEILQKLAARALDALTAKSDEEKRRLFGEVANLVNRKDIMLYFADPQIQSAVLDYGLGGAIYETQKDFMGDYLAVLDANIGGGKSDAFMKRSVSFESEIGADGIVRNHLVLDVEHQGAASPDWWYKVTNQNYIQIFTPLSSELTDAEGGIEKTVASSIDYQKAGYKTNPLVMELESGAKAAPGYPAVFVHEESGKKVFSTWSKIASGEKARVAFEYSHKLLKPLSEGQTYQFVFEKQSGSRKNYSFTITAPAGFVFEETNRPVFKYESSDPSGRFIISLTPRKLP